MISIEDDGAKRVLDLVETSIKEDRPITREEAKRLLSTKSMSFTLNAYENLLKLSKDDMITIITSLGEADPTQSEPAKRRFEEGFRSCYSLEVVERLRRELEAAARIPFDVAEEKALRHLPPDTTIESTVYLTVDAFNPGMVRNGNVGLSIISSLEKVSTDYLAHEFHHVGFANCLSGRPEVERMAKNPKAPEEAAIQLICHLVSEGMANHYCTPTMVRAGEHKSPQANEKILSYERSLTEMLDETWTLIADCMDGGAPLDEYREHVMDILIDRESILPKVHFIGEKMISLIEEDPETRPEDMIDLCNHPENLISLYTGPARRKGLPSLPDEYAEKILNVVG
jgi:hypothetical protein